MTASRTSSLGAYARFIGSLPSYFKKRITLDEARTIIQERLANRAAMFLDLVEHRILANPRSPYTPMLKLAGCELGDLRDMVRQKGLEATLLALREAGVHLTWEESKGRQPIVRDGQVIHVGPYDLYNPVLKAYFEAQTGGSTGAAAKVAVSQHRLIDAAPAEMLWRHAHGVLDAPYALWHLILPASDGISEMLTPSYFGRVPARWFWQGATGSRGTPLHWRLATYGVTLVVRLLGVPAPWPQRLPLDQAIVLARWAAQAVQDHGAAMVHTYVSMALRVSAAAQEHGLDLSGVTFMAGGEPPSEGKVQGIERSGARFVPLYAMTEIGLVGYGCAQPADDNDNHLLTDVVALIQYPRPLPGTDVNVDAFYFTTLLPTTQKVLLNVESDDFGLLEERHCGCPLEAVGYTKHLRDIQSFTKLKAEGMTIEGGAMVWVLEEVLPARFGGTPLDYQLVEEQDEQGFTRLNLRISPRVQIGDEKAVLEAVWQALSTWRTQADVGVWEQAQTLCVQRAQPIVTARGKFMPMVRHKVSAAAITERKEKDRK